MSSGQGSGGFDIPDDTGGGSNDLNTLFGVNQRVGEAGVTLSGIGMSGADVRRFGEPDLYPDKKTNLSSALQMFYGLDPEALANLQAQLLAGGFYGSSYYSSKPKKPQFGNHDDDSYAAFKKAVVQAARSGQPLDTLIADAADNRAKNAEAAGATPVQFTHPDDLRAAFDSLGPSVIGRRPDAGVVDNAIAAYHELEASGVNKPDAAGNVTGPPSVSAYVEQWLRRTYPADAYRNGYADAYNTLSDLIKSTANG